MSAKRRISSYLLYFILPTDAVPIPHEVPLPDDDSSSTKGGGERGHLTTSSAAVSRQNVADGQPSPSKQAKTGPGQNLFPQTNNNTGSAGPSSASALASASRLALKQGGLAMRTGKACKAGPMGICPFALLFSQLACLRRIRP